MQVNSPNSLTFIALGKRSSKQITKEESKIADFDSKFDEERSVDAYKPIKNHDTVSSVFSSAILTSQQKAKGGINPLLQQLLNRQKKG